MFRLATGGARGLLCTLPMMLCSGICGMCSCCCCGRFRIRNFACIKRLLRCIGCDRFDDFEMTMLVHESFYDQKKSKIKTTVRITAGDHSVMTDASSSGMYQQPLTVLVEQGTDDVKVELLDSRESVVAVLKLDPEADVLLAKHFNDKVFDMKSKGKAVTHPKVKLSLALDTPEDEETGLLAGLGITADSQWFLKGHALKGEGAAGASQLEMLAQACAGPLEVFEGLGHSKAIYLSPQGPPLQKKWRLCQWANQHDFDKQCAPIKEVEISRICSVQPDQSRTNVFNVNYYDEYRVQHQLCFRRVDRNRDVWVELLQLLVKQVNAERKAKKEGK